MFKNAKVNMRKDRQLMILWLPNGFDRTNPFEIEFLPLCARQKMFSTNLGVQYL